MPALILSPANTSTHRSPSNPDFIFRTFIINRRQTPHLMPIRFSCWIPEAIRNTVFAGIEAEEQASGGHFIEEDIKAYYVQADFEMDALFGIPASGNFGVRIVTTDVDTQGNSTNVDDVLKCLSQPVINTQKYCLRPTYQLLPNR